MNLKLFLKQYIKMAAQNGILPIWYKICCRKPIIPGLVLFADAHHDQRPGNMELLYQALVQMPSEKEKTLRVKEFYLDYQKHSPIEVLKQMFLFMKWYAQADSVVICDNFLPVASCRKRKETRVIQLWHACGALKKFGYDTADDIPKNYRGNVFKNIDLVTVSAKKCVEPFASAMRLPEYCVQPIGVSRTDVYVQEEWRENCRKKFYEKYPEAEGKKIVLWAPTFRGNPGAPELIALDLKKLQQQLGDEWLVLSKVHPHMRAQYKETDCSIGTERLFPVVDVLIADYSSLVFEYLLFDRSLVLYVPDLQEYQEKRGFYLEFSEIPGKIVQKEELLAAAIREEYQKQNAETEITEDAFKIVQQRKEKQDRFLREYMSGCDGSATERIVQYIFRQNKEA